MAKFSKVCIIYNPTSTRDSKAMANVLRLKMQKEITDIKIECVETKHAGHARELAHKIALSEARPLIVSASGDGGYNEVINGVMEAANPRAVCAVLPTGNANDHSRAVHKKPIIHAIIKGDVRHLDLIKITIVKDGAKTVRYAHSYAGLGLTPAMATELTDFKMQFVKELLQVVKLYRRPHSFKIMRRGAELELDNLLFANTYQMAKILTLAPRTLPNDGLFEVIISPSKHKLELARRIVKAAVSKLKTVRSLQKYEFTTLHGTPMQMDGELIQLEAHSKVTVESAHRALATII